MDEERINRICQLGDNLAIYVRKQGGKRFFRAFFTEQNANVFIGILIKANMVHIKAGYEPLFDVHAFIDVFMQGEDVMRLDWKLARDLVFMRLIDQLQNWLADNPDALPESEIETTVTAS